MRKVTTTIALLALVGTSVAIAQRARSSMNPDKQLHDAPVADQVRSEKTLMDPNEIMVLKGLSLPPRE
jgi:Spy/CpxP family protein refolding chaperone